MSDFVIHGADDFLRLSKALKAAGRTGTRKELHKGLRDAANKAKPKAADALAAALPSGLAARGKSVHQAVRVKTGRDPGVSIVVQFGRAGRGLGGRNAQLVNQSGTFRHPVFGTGRWVSQRAGGSGWFDKTYMNEAPAIRADLARVLDDVVNKIVRDAKG